MSRWDSDDDVDDIHSITLHARSCHQTKGTFPIDAVLRRLARDADRSNDAGQKKRIFAAEKAIRNGLNEDRGE